MRLSVATMGVAAHSGWAAVVALGRTPKGPQVLARSRVDLIEDDCPESKQPYHAVEALGLEEASQRLNRYRRQAEARAHSALHRLLEEVAGRGFRLTSVGILESSGRKGSSLEAILASHAAIHSADGDHFRNALSTAAQGLGLAVSRVPARDLDTRAAACLHQPLNHLGEAVRQLGRQVGSPWGADQKQSALLAWLLLEL
ncbi:MAG: hypothetical protein WA803_01045 [Steroidobacteraceae bacterium]